MDVFHTLLRPLVTEKSTHQAGKSSERRGGAYSFEVHVHANKAEIRDAVEKIYGVKVLEVRTSTRVSKMRRFRQYRVSGQRSKKAVVVLAPGSHIELF
jgi:large subunit ribosomal protein L23